MIKTYFISDTHFFHEKIIEYENRPFKDVQNMNAKLIENWNNTVAKDDKVFILGDFGLGKVYNLKGILQQLHGYKMLVMGNHDRAYKTNLSMGFDEVSKYPILYKGNYILSHQPIEAPGAYFNIHGHIHSQIIKDKKHFNVSVEANEYKPVNFNVIENYYKNLFIDLKSIPVK